MSSSFPALRWPAMHRVTMPVLAAWLILAPPNVRAQVGSMRVSVPSPTAASLGKFGDIPVSLYSGVPNISIPLFTAKGRTLELPIALSYHASGVRVEEIGGWAGIGWSLEAGGVITRTARGTVDEKGNGYFNTGYRLYEVPDLQNPPVTFQTVSDVAFSHWSAGLGLWEPSLQLIRAGLS